MTQAARPGAPGLGIVLILLMAACFATMDTTVRYVGALLPVPDRAAGALRVQAVAWACGSPARDCAAAPASAPRTRVPDAARRAAADQSAFGFSACAPAGGGVHRHQHAHAGDGDAAGGHGCAEQVSRLRWALVVGGFAGALIVIRPGSGLFGWAVLLPLAAAQWPTPAFQVLTSKLSALESPYTTHFYTGLTGTLVVAAAAAGQRRAAARHAAGATALQMACCWPSELLGTTGTCC
jgi:drug/metabolite transporter (DMT)-like permease